MTSLTQILMESHIVYSFLCITGIPCHLDWILHNIHVRMALQYLITVQRTCIGILCCPQTDNNRHITMVTVSLPNISVTSNKKIKVTQLLVNSQHKIYNRVLTLCNVIGLSSLKVRHKNAVTQDFVRNAIPVQMMKQCTRIFQYFLVSWCTVTS